MTTPSSEQWHSSFQADWGALAQLMADQTKEMHARVISKRQALRMGTNEPNDDSVQHNPYLKKQTKADLDRLATLRSTTSKQAEIHRYEAMFDEFRAATGIDDLDKLIKLFQEQVLAFGIFDLALKERLYRNRRRSICLRRRMISRS